MVGVATPTVTTATTMAAATPGATTTMSVIPLITAVAVPLFCAAKLFLGLLRSWPQHRGLSFIVGPTEGDNQGQGWRPLLLPTP